MKNLIAITLLFLSINIFSQNSANATIPEKKYVQEKRIILMKLMVTNILYM